MKRVFISLNRFSTGFCHKADVTTLSIACFLLEFSGVMSLGASLREKEVNKHRQHQLPFISTGSYEDRPRNVARFQCNSSIKNPGAHTECNASSSLEIPACAIQSHFTFQATATQKLFSFHSTQLHPRMESFPFVLQHTCHTVRVILVLKICQHREGSQAEAVWTADFFYPMWWRKLECLPAMFWLLSRKDCSTNDRTDVIGYLPRLPKQPVVGSVFPTMTKVDVGLYLRCHLDRNNIRETVGSILLSLKAKHWPKANKWINVQKDTEKKNQFGNLLRFPLVWRLFIKFATDTHVDPVTCFKPRKPDGC